MVHWSEASKLLLLSCVKDELAISGNVADNGFKKQQWTKILEAFNRRKAPGEPIADKEKLQNQLSTLKKKYVIFKHLKENSGFGWDDVRRIPTAPPDVWERYLAAHKDAKEFRDKTLQFFQELDEIFT
jgi:hypothetical protein